MKRKKNSMALFEVVAREKQKTHKAVLTVPDWMKRRPAANAPEQAPPIPPPADVPPEGQYAGPQEPAPAVEAPAPARRSGAAAAGGEVLSVSDGRVTLSLNYVSCTVAGVGLVLAILAAFLLGRASAPEVPAARAGKQPAARAGLRLGVTPPTAPQRISGKYYLVIQELGGRTQALKADAENIAAYCRAARDDNVTVFDDGQQYLVLSGKPFDSRTGDDTREYAGDIQTLGNRYKTDINNRYDFNQTNIQGKLDPWYRQEQ